MLNDELHYYLHVRNLLFKGSQLLDIQAAQEPMYLVEQKTALNLVDMVFGHASSQEIEAIKEKITKIGEEKANQFQIADPAQLPIDSQMVLRVFLEYYRNEKKAKSYIIKRLFLEQASSNKFSLTFDQFRHVLYQLHPEISDLELVKLYRDAWMMGNGKVNFDTFFLAANETNFLVKVMKLRGYNNPPNIDHNQEIDVTFGTPEGIEVAKQYSHVYRCWQAYGKEI